MLVRTHVDNAGTGLSSHVLLILVVASNNNSSDVISIVLRPVEARSPGDFQYT